MWISFDSMPADARVWVYQANRDLAVQEVTQLKEYFKEQIGEWSTHGTALKASAEIYYNRFVVMAVDEEYQAPSGCSIDKSTHWIKEAGQNIGVDFLDRSVAYFDNQKVVSVSLANLKKCVNEGIIGRDTIIFNNSVTKFTQLANEWMVPAEQSWMARYFSKTLA